MQHLPAMEYAVVDTSKKRASQEQLKPDAQLDNTTAENKTINVSVFNTHVKMCMYVHTYLTLQQAPAMEYAVVDTSKKRASREQLKPDAQLDNTTAENKKVNVSVLNAVATHVKMCTYIHIWHCSKYQQWSML